MQGRLSALVDGKIQSFPWDDWEGEFAAAAAIGLPLMEWTLDQARLYENPLMTATGRETICALSGRHGVSIPSLTGDCFMHAPFWKAEGVARSQLQRDFLAILGACAQAGIGVIVLPVVDDGRLADRAQEDVLVAFLLEQQAMLTGSGLRIAFESDYGPTELARFIGRLPRESFGVNYDIGNSAALGFDPAEEFAAYGTRVINVHVKDRVLGGTTVPLGRGDADFDLVFSSLAGTGYRGDFILQAARAADGNHAEALRAYRDMTLEWMSRHGLAMP